MSGNKTTKLYYDTTSDGSGTDLVSYDSYDKLQPKYPDYPSLKLEQFRESVTLKSFSHELDRGTIVLDSDKSVEIPFQTDDLPEDIQMSKLEPGARMLGLFAIDDYGLVSIVKLQMQ